MWSPCLGHLGWDPAHHTGDSHGNLDYSPGLDGTVCTHHLLFQLAYLHRLHSRGAGMRRTLQVCIPVSRM